MTFAWEIFRILFVDLDYSTYFKGLFLKMSLAALTHTEIYSFIHICILKVFAEGFVHISLTW